MSSYARRTRGRRRQYGPATSEGSPLLIAPSALHSRRLFARPRGALPPEPAGPPLAARARPRPRRSRPRRRPSRASSRRHSARSISSAVRSHSVAVFRGISPSAPAGRVSCPSSQFSGSGGCPPALRSSRRAASGSALGHATGEELGGPQRRDLSRATAVSTNWLMLVPSALLISATAARVALMAASSAISFGRVVQLRCARVNAYAFPV